VTAPAGPRRGAAVSTQALLQITLAAAAIIALFPFFWMLSASLKPIEEILAPGLRLLPEAPTLQNYATAASRAPLLRFLLNGAIVCGAILLLQLLVIIPAGYAFGRLEFPWRDQLFILVLAALVVPAQITAIPNFLLLSDLKLINTYPALVLPFIGSAFGTFLMRQFFRQLPGDVLDAARIDGCNTRQLIWYVLLPLTRPAVAAFSIFSVVAHWNDFFWPLVVIRSAELMTPPAGIAYFADLEAGSNWGAVMAAAVIIVGPLVALFLIARKQFIESLAHTAVKG
jgi:multiple sugar transport system permease protein